MNLSQEMCETVTSRRCSDVIVFRLAVETQRDRSWTCEPNPCKNGGTCKPGISKCVCRLGYAGNYCESKDIHLVRLSVC